MQSFDFVSWTNVFEETLDGTIINPPELRAIVTIHPSNIYPVFAVRASNFTGGVLNAVILRFGFQDSDILLTGTVGQQSGTFTGNGVFAFMIPDPIGVAWPLSHVPPRMGIFVTADDGSTGFFGTYSVHVSMRAGK